MTSVGHAILSVSGVEGATKSHTADFSSCFFLLDSANDGSIKDVY